MVFIVGLVLSGATAIPLKSELDALARLTKAERVISDFGSAGGAYPFLFYGTDWLAFGHFTIALGFIGALRDPVRSIPVRFCFASAGRLNWSSS